MADLVLTLGDLGSTLGRLGARGASASGPGNLCLWGGVGRAGNIELASQAPKRLRNTVGVPRSRRDESSQGNTAFQCWVPRREGQGKRTHEGQCLRGFCVGTAIRYSPGDAGADLYSRSSSMQAMRVQATLPSGLQKQVLQSTFHLSPGPLPSGHADPSSGIAARSSCWAAPSPFASP